MTKCLALSIAKIFVALYRLYETLSKTFEQIFALLLARINDHVYLLKGDVFEKQEDPLKWQNLSEGEMFNFAEKNYYNNTYNNYNNNYNNINNKNNNLFKLESNLVGGGGVRWKSQRILSAMVADMINI